MKSIIVPSRISGHLHYYRKHTHHNVFTDHNAGIAGRQDRLEGERRQ